MNPAPGSDFLAHAEGPLSSRLLPVAQTVSQPPQEAESSNECSILDYLNEDCWRLVLDYVPVRHIILTERTSRNWQKLVLRYLQGVRINIILPTYNEDVNHQKACMLRPLHMHIWSFHNWTKKLGASIASIYCSNEDTWRVIEKNCPNLEALMLYNMTRNLLLSGQNEGFKRLKRVCFDGHYPDNEISQFITNNCSDTLEELEIRLNGFITGQCLTDLQMPNLTTLILSRCEEFEVHHLISTITRFRKLIRLEMERLDDPFCREIALVLDKVPQLEYLRTDARSRVSSVDFFQSVCQLKHLKYLGVSGIRDEELEAVTRCCPDLVSMDLNSSNARIVSAAAVSVRGLAAMCRHVGARLTSLGLHFLHLFDDDIVTCVRACPKLKTLDLRGCWHFWGILLPRVAQARREVRARRPLRLRLSDVSLLTKAAKLGRANYPELIIDLPRIHWPDGDVGIGEVIWRSDDRENDGQAAINWFYGDLGLREEFRELQVETS